MVEELASTQRLLEERVDWRLRAWCDLTQENTPVELSFRTLLSWTLSLPYCKLQVSPTLFLIGAKLYEYYKHPLHDEVLVAGLSSMCVCAGLEVEAEEEQTVVEGENVTLICNVTGFPAPRIKWHRVNEDSVIILESDSFQFGTYELTNVGEDQAGTYRCTGQYTFGSEEADIELVVFSKWGS